MKKLVLAVLGLALLVSGYVIGSRLAGNKPAATVASQRRILHYVDPMNPAHTSEQPGLAPCGMKMEPVYAEESGTATSADGDPLPPGAVKVSPAKQQLIGIQTAVVEKEHLEIKVRLLGKVAPDETRVYRINATVDGWITKALPVATGDRVTNGQTLATFYSPEFLSAGQALLFALNSQDRMRPMTNATAVENNQMAQFSLNLQQYRDSLRNLGMSPAQIDDMIQSRKFAQHVNLVAPADGFVSGRNVSEGLRFEKGTEFFRITDLRRVWILADVFERDARWIKPGAIVRVSLPHQNHSFPAIVSDALPQFDAVTRTLKVRLTADNPDFALKPDMFVDAEVSTDLPETLVVPAAAVLDAGLRQTVFVDRGEGFFEPRAVTLGERSGDQVQILSGLMAGERIVVAGNFLLDSESRMQSAAAGPAAPAKDVVCGMTVNEAKARAAGRVFDHAGKTYFFCNDGCKIEFAADPEKFLKPAAANASATDASPQRDQPHH